MKIYDIVIIGSGPGGYISAIRSSQLGFKTALIEKYNKLGGTCLNVGCIPSKTILDSSEKFYEAKNSFIDHGISFYKLFLNFENLIKRKDRIVEQLASGVKFLIKKNNIDIIYGNASFYDTNTLMIKSLNKEKFIHFKHAIIATGSKPKKSSYFNIDHDKIITSNEALSLKEIPKNLIILGGGVIGVELGSVYSRLGSNVKIIEYEKTIVSFMDYDIGLELKKILMKQGIEFYLSKKILEVKRENSNISVKVEDQNGYISNIIGDYCLVTIGRIPFTDNLGIKKLKIKIDEKGFIKVDKNLRTNINNIYAIGDVIGGNMLAHKASDEGIYVVEIIAGQKPSINYKNIPSVIYTSPEVASVGYTEEELKKENINYNIGKFPLKSLGRAISTGNIYGFTKILTESKTDEILGAHIISPRASDLIMEIVLAMEFKASSEDIYRICHPHPTFTESLKEASMLSFIGKSLHS